MPDAFRFTKAYSVTQAARMAGTSPQNVRRWLAGYSAPGHQMEPVFGDPRGIAGEVSFLELAEIVVVARFRKGNRVALQRLRDARAFVRRTWPDVEYPFASLRLLEFGGQVLHSFDEQHSNGDQALAISMEGQWVLPGVVANALHSFEFADDGLARLWYPAGRDVPVVVDPNRAGGRPTVVGSGVTVETVHRRFFDGAQTIEFIADDLSLEQRQVEEVIRYARAA